MDARRLVSRGVPRNKRPKIIAIVGPTASGKTALGIALARRFGGEIISADSRQIYRGMDIGTGKVSAREARGAPHHLIDILPPSKPFSAGAFAKLGKEKIYEIAARGHMPIVVGGTGFFAEALLSGHTLPDVPPDPTLRKRLANRSPAQLYAQLKKLDPRRAGEIDRRNPARLVRAIEIAKALGRVPKRKTRKEYDVLWLGIDPGEKKLNEHIRRRLHARMKADMIAEAKRLHARGVSYKRMEELGLEYRFLAKYLKGELEREEMTQALEARIRDYAKRQRRWFKRNPDIRWVKSSVEAVRLVKGFLS